MLINPIKAVSPNLLQNVKQHRQSHPCMYKMLEDFTLIMFLLFYEKESSTDVRGQENILGVSSVFMYYNVTCTFFVIWGLIKYTVRSNTFLMPITMFSTQKTYSAFLFIDLQKQRWVVLSWITYMYHEFTARVN